MLRELIAVRHGESTANVAFGRADGRRYVWVRGRDADVPLSNTGRAQSARFGRWLAGQPARRQAEVVLCSPYRRARQTLDIVLAELASCGRPAPPVELDERLRDRETGVFELLNRAAIRAFFPAEADRWEAEGELRYRPPQGESMLDVGGRLRDLYGEISTRHAGRRVLVLAHDATVVMLRRVIECLPDREMLAVITGDRIRNTSVTRWASAANSDHLQLVEWNTVPAEVERPG